MREFKDGDYVLVYNETERDLFLKYLDENTEIVWNDGGEKPSEYIPDQKFPYCFSLNRGKLLYTIGRDNVFDSGVLKVSDFVQTKPEPTWALFWDDGSQVKCKSIFLTELEGAVEPFISVHKDDIDKHLHGKKFKTAKWGNMLLLSNELDLKAEILAKIEVMDLDELINLRENL